MHGPLQAKEADLAKYRGRYDAGWDAVRAARFERQKAMGLVPPGTRLAERDPAVPAWDDVPADQQRLFARHMETYAAMLDCADQNIGRLVALLEELGELDNTIFVFSSDNGGTNSAGPAGALHFNRRYAGLPALPVEVDLEREAWIGTGRGSAVYPMGWAQVSNTPFPSYKTYTGGGGRRVSFVVSWPDKLKDFGADAQPVRPCDRRDADPARSRRSAGSRNLARRARPADAGQEPGAGIARRRRSGAAQ